MSPHLIPQYRTTTELAVDAMISEGGAIRQPSMRDSQAVFERLHKPGGFFAASLREWMHNPMSLFWTGFAAGIALSFLDKAAHPHTEA